MNKEVRDLRNTISILEGELRNTQQLLNEKRIDLKFLCTHDEINKTIVRKKDFVLPELGLPCPNSESYIYYKCKICGWGIIKDNEDPELEKRVVII